MRCLRVPIAAAAFAERIEVLAARRVAGSIVTEISIAIAKSLDRTHLPSTDRPIHSFDAQCGFRSLADALLDNQEASVTPGVER